MGLGTRNGRVFWGAAVITLALDFVTKRLAQSRLIDSRASISASTTPSTC